MTYEIRSISQLGGSEPFELQVARGQIPGHSFRHVVGEVPAMSNNQSGSLWDVNDTVYPWSAFDSPGTLSIARASAEDADKNVIINGLDVLFNEITETVSLTAASGNTTTNSFARLYSARMNGLSENVGNVTITRGGYDRSADQRWCWSDDHGCVHRSGWSHSLSDARRYDDPEHRRCHG